MHDTFSCSHYTKTKVTGLTHHTARTIITIHRHPCIKFLSSPILYPPHPHPSPLQPGLAASSNRPACSGLQPSGPKSIRPFHPRLLVLQKQDTFLLLLLLFFVFLPCSHTICNRGPTPAPYQVSCD